MKTYLDYLVIGAIVLILTDAYFNMKDHQMLIDRMDGLHKAQTTDIKALEQKHSEGG